MRPRNVEESVDRIGALRLGRRLAHFRVLTEHPVFHQLHRRLNGGQSSERIAQWLLSTLPYDDPLGAGSTTQEALARRLRRFRAALPDGVMLSQGYLDRRYRSLDAGIDALIELDALIRYQKTRVEILAEREPEFRLPIEAQRRGVETLAELLMKRHIMAIGLGLTRLVQIGQMNLASCVRNAGPAGPTLEEIVHEHPDVIPAMTAFFDAIDEAAAGGGGTFQGPYEGSPSGHWTRRTEAHSPTAPGSERRGRPDDLTGASRPIGRHRGVVGRQPVEFSLLGPHCAAAPGRPERRARSRAGLPRNRDGRRGAVAATRRRHGRRFGIEPEAGRHWRPARFYASSTRLQPSAGPV